MIEGLIIPFLLRDGTPSLSAFQNHLPELFGSMSISWTTKTDANNCNRHDSIHQAKCHLRGSARIRINVSTIAAFTSDTVFVSARHDVNLDDSTLRRMRN